MKDCKIEIGQNYKEIGTGRLCEVVDIQGRIIIYKFSPSDNPKDPLSGISTLKNFSQCPSLR